MNLNLLEGCCGKMRPSAPHPLGSRIVSGFGLTGVNCSGLSIFRVAQNKLLFSRVVYRITELLKTRLTAVIVGLAHSLARAISSLRLLRRTLGTFKFGLFLRCPFSAVVVSNSTFQTDVPCIFRDVSSTMFAWIHELTMGSQNYKLPYRLQHSAIRFHRLKTAITPTCVFVFSVAVNPKRTSSINRHT
jgi:hypothetical protein